MRFVLFWRSTWSGAHVQDCCVTWSALVIQLIDLWWPLELKQKVPEACHHLKCFILISTLFLRRRHSMARLLDNICLLLSTGLLRRADLPCDATVLAWEGTVSPLLGAASDDGSPQLVRQICWHGFRLLQREYSPVSFGSGDFWFVWASFPFIIGVFLSSPQHLTEWYGNAGCLCLDVYSCIWRTFVKVDDCNRSVWSSNIFFWLCQSCILYPIILCCVMSYDSDIFFQSIILALYTSIRHIDNYVCISYFLYIVLIICNFIRINKWTMTIFCITRLAYCIVEN